MALIQTIKQLYLTITEQTVPANPDSGDQRLYIDSADNKLKRVNSSGTVTTIEGAAGVARSGSTTDAHLAVWNGGNADSIKDGGVVPAGGATIYQSAYASPPGSPADGDEWHSQSYIAHRASSAWTYYGALRAMEPPLALTNWTIFNPGTVLTTDDTEGAIHCKYVTGGGDHIRGIKRAFPNPVKATIAFSALLMNSNNYTRAGICVSDGTIYKTWQKCDAGGGGVISVWSNADTLGAETTFTGNVGWYGPIFWMQYEEDTTNRIIRISSDGFYWHDVITETKTTSLTATQWGFALYAEGTCYATLLHVHEG